MRFIIIICSICLLAHLTAEDLGPNLYWPGNFEQGLYGGIYSNNVKCTLSRQENHSPNGQQCWELKKGYQHLELLVPGHKQYRLQFSAKTKHQASIIFKIVTPAPEDADTKNKTINSTITLEASEAWNDYSFDFTTIEPYPGPIQTEIIITLYNGNDDSIFIDDLRVQELNPAKPIQNHDQWVNSTFPINGNFSAGSQHWKLSNNGAQRAEYLRISSKHNTEQLPYFANTVVAHNGQLAGQTVLLQADIAYETYLDMKSPWSAVLIEMANGKQLSDGRISPSVKPFWYPFSLSAPTKQAQTVQASFIVPEDSMELCIQFMMQGGLLNNIARIDNVQISVLKN